MRLVEEKDVKKIVKGDCLLAIGGFTINRKPMELVRQIAESGAKNISIFTLAGSMDVDTLIKSGKVSKVFAAYVGYEGLGGSKITRKSVEAGEIEFEDITELSYYLGLSAGASGREFIRTKSMVNSDILKNSSFCKKINVGKDVFCHVGAVKPDFCIIHAHKADKNGNISIKSPDFSEVEMAKASKIAIFSVEELGDLNPEEITISCDFVDYVVVSKGGALPTGCEKNYGPDIKKINYFVENA